MAGAVERVLLVVAPATTDIIVTPRGLTVRPGGPGLYAAAAAGLLGYETIIAGGWGHANACTIIAERRLGAHRVSPPTAGSGAVFRLDYTRGERRLAIESPPPATGADEALAALRDARPAAAIVSPVHGDTPPGLPALMRGRTLVTGLDLQGYARAGLIHALPRGSADIVHASAGEAPESVVAKLGGVALVTAGYGPILAVSGGTTRRIAEAPPGSRLEDPTGAGDAFLALTLLLVLEGETLEGAALEAASLVPRALERARGAARLGCEEWSRQGAGATTS